MTLNKDPKPADNLGKRHRDLNKKVADTIANNVNFDDLKNAPESSDLDRLYKIDVAAKCKQLDYIIEVLKSADSLYTTRALNKCKWLFEDEYSHIINPEFLSINIFPFISNKMTRKILTTVSLHVRSEERSLKFFKYCMEMKLNNIACKFLLFTSKEFKLYVVHKDNTVYHDIIKKQSFEYLRNYVKKSYTLLEACLNLMSKEKSTTIVRNFQFLYKLSNNKYLDLLEKYIIADSRCKEFDTKLSTDIMKNHKARLLAKPCFYLNMIDRNIVKSNITMEDAKILAVAVLPNDSREFWFRYFYENYKYILALIPREEMYAFIKKIFNDKYPGAEFEMSLDFYLQCYHDFMTIEEREEWARRHLKTEEQILGVECDYKWYRFINFNDAFEAIKQYIMITNEPDKRNEMTEILVESARNNQELETLFVYYEKRHRNETRTIKDSFLHQVIKLQNVFEFNQSCWEAFHNLLVSMNIYTTLCNEEIYHINNETYKSVTLLHHIVNEKVLTEPLQNHLLEKFNVEDIKTYIPKINEVKKNKLYEFLHGYYMNKIMEFKYEPFTMQVDIQSGRFYKSVVGLMSIFNKAPVMYVNSKKRPHQRKKVRRQNYSLSDRELLRRLKTDKDKIINIVSVFEKDGLSTIHMDTFLKKIKIYFPGELTQSWLDLFKNQISNKLNIKQIQAAVYGYFQLADENEKINFMNLHSPKSDKIDHAVISDDDLNIQIAICKFACYSRPLVPIPNIVAYLKGDYVKYCLHIFNKFYADLSPALCLQFVESILDSPVSLQKHGIRLAFKCCDDENLQKVVTEIWRKTKNVSLRGVIYKELFNKLCEEEQVSLFEALRNITLTIHKDDENEIFNMLLSDRLSKKFLGEYYEAIWSAVGQFPEKEPNITRKANVIQNTYTLVFLMREQFVRDIVDNHLKTMFIEDKLHQTYSNETISKLYNVKWELTGRYLAYFTGSTLSADRYVELTRHIIKCCTDKWYHVTPGSQSRQYLELACDMISIIKRENYLLTMNSLTKVRPLFEEILKVLTSSLPLSEVYFLIWDLRLTIISKEIAEKYRHNVKEENVDQIQLEASREYARSVGETVVEFIKNRQYFSSLSTKISDVIQSNAEDLVKSISSINNSNRELIVIANGLLQFNVKETYILALHLLPTTEKQIDTEMFRSVIKKLMSSPDTEVQCGSCIKFNSNMNKKRRYQ